MKFIKSFFCKELKLAQGGCAINIATLSFRMSLFVLIEICNVKVVKCNKGIVMNRPREAKSILKIKTERLRKFVSSFSFYKYMFVIS